MKKTSNDVIAAIATPIGKGAISCIRLSGEGSADIVRKVTIGYPVEKKHGVMITCRFDGRVKDKIMAVVYYGERSYTGEESAELYFHGGKYLTEQALLGIIDAGARPANAGEFTQRAFLNGKIDLTQAEGIIDLIDGDSMSALEAAYEQSEGKTRKAIEEIYDKLTTAAAEAEVCIDYPEEDIEEQTKTKLVEKIDSLIETVQKEIDGYDCGRIKRDGARIVLTGKTNAGKSTLFNTLLGEDRAIVSDEEGTTRDTVEEKLLYRGIALVLVDTAGLRETQSKAEKLGIERSKEAARKADVTLHVIKDISENIGNTQDNEMVVLNRFDDGQYTDGKDFIAVNAKTGKGTEKLKEEIYRRVKDKTSGGGNINNPRQYAALAKARDCLIRAKEAVYGLTLDCVCSDLIEALGHLGKITGKNASDSVIEEIFSRFCVGK